MFGDEIPPIVDNSYKDTYLTIKGPAEATVRERGSRFLSFAYPVSSQKEADSYVAALRKKYYDATHHCFAWRMGNDIVPRLHRIRITPSNLKIDPALLA